MAGKAAPLLMATFAYFHNHKSTAVQGLRGMLISPRVPADKHH